MADRHQERRGGRRLTPRRPRFEIHRLHPVGLNAVARDRLPPARVTGKPVRTCIGCRERATTRELLRVVAGLDASGRPAVVPDPDGTAPGRGAHLHPTSACYDLAVRRRAFARALRLEQGLASTPVGDYLASHTN